MNEYDEKNEGARERKSRGLYLCRALGPRASQVGGQAHSKQLDFRHQLVPIAQPSCPRASLITGLFDTPHRLTASQPRVWGRCSPLAQVLFVAGAIGAGGAAMRPSPGGEAGAPRDATNPIRRLRSLRSPPAANTPRLLPQREEFPPLQGDLWLPTLWELVTPSLANKPWSEGCSDVWGSARTRAGG